MGSACPFCGSPDFRRGGTDNGRQRYRCLACGRTFNALTGTVLSKTRKRQAAWEGFVLSMTNDRHPGRLLGVRAHQQEHPTSVAHACLLEDR